MSFNDVAWDRLGFIGHHWRLAAFAKGDPLRGKNLA